MINLTKQERNRFAAYLEEEAKNDNLLLEQITKLMGKDHRIVQEKKFGVAAYLYVAKRLGSIEEYTIK